MVGELIDGTSQREGSDSAKATGDPQRDQGDDKAIDLDSPKPLEQPAGYATERVQSPDEPIELISSEDVPPPPRKGLSRSKAFRMKDRKIRKRKEKCRKCRHVLMLDESVICSTCRCSFHRKCILIEAGAQKLAQCSKCRRLSVKAKLKGPSGRSQISEAGRIQNRKLEKERRSAAYEKRLVVFQQRYPYYVNQGRVKYPIEDKLLLIYRELHEAPDLAKPAPKSHPTIPTEHLASVLQIQNFFSTFESKLREFAQLPGSFRKQRIYDALNNEDKDQTYHSLLCCLLRIYLGDLFDKNKVENLRVLAENNFFTLIMNINEHEELTNEFIMTISDQLLANIALMPSFKRAFDRIELPKVYSRESKLKLLSGLIAGLSQVDSFRELVRTQSDLIINLTKVRGEIVSKIKTDDAQALNKREKLKEAPPPPEQSQEEKIALKTRAKAKTKTIDSQTRSELEIQSLRKQVAEIGRKLPFLTSQVLFLGRDRNGSQYYFFEKEPNLLYVNFKAYMTDQEPKFLIYEGKQIIVDVMKSLNTKGRHEKSLYEGLHGLIKDGIINDKPLQEDSDENERPLSKPITLDLLKNTLIDIEKTFNSYLIQRNFRWLHVVEKEQFFARVKKCESLQTFKELLRQMQEGFLFVQTGPTEGKRTLLDSEAENQEDEIKQIRRKNPVKIWGINSEKIKKYWLQHLEECTKSESIWLCLCVFENHVSRYVKKKFETISEEEKKLGKTDKLKRGRLRKRSRSRSVVESEEEPGENSSDSIRRPSFRNRLRPRAQTHVRQQQIKKYIQQSSSQSQSSSNEEVCEVCGDYGSMICCDTCPKVYHLKCLKIKEIPTGNWSCFKCLTRISLQRQTRHNTRTNRMINR